MQNSPNAMPAFRQSVDTSVLLRGSDPIDFTVDMRIASIEHFGSCTKIASMPQQQTNKILGRTIRLPTKQRKFFDRIFHSADGNVLDFTTRTMDEWFQETCGLQIFQTRFQFEGTSKGKTLRGFVAVAEPRLVARVLRALWIYRCKLENFTEQDSSEEALLSAWFQQFVTELDATTTMPIEDAIRNFSDDTTLAKLRASIAEDLIGEKPDVALDRIHTYCVKRLRHLLAAKGTTYDSDTPLDALFGAYGRILKDTGAVSEFALPTLRVQHKLFDGLNQARNNRSFAHDNELLSLSEAQFMVDCTLASLAFIERIEAS